MKSNSWNKISGFPFCYDDIAGCGGAAAGDTLNWVALKKFELYSERFIFGFDLKNEDIFFLVVGPDIQAKCPIVSLDGFGGCLSSVNIFTMHG